MLDKGAIAPTKGHKDDAGYDLMTPEAYTIPARGSATIDTGVHVQIPEGYCGMIKSKSGLNVNKDLITEGVIDCGYTGTIVVKIYNLGNTPRYFKKGDKITQLVVIPYYTKDDTINIVSEFPESERGNNGFGSTGR